MIDFQNPSFVKLRPMDADAATAVLEQMLIDGEYVLQAFRGVRDKIVITNKRLVAINVQGITGKKVDYSSLPFSKLQAFSVETPGVLDRDCELELWFSGLGKVKLEFTGSYDIRALAKIIGSYVMG